MRLKTLFELTAIGALALALVACDSNGSSTGDTG